LGVWFVVLIVCVGVGVGGVVFCRCVWCVCVCVCVCDLLISLHPQVMNAIAERMARQRESLEHKERAIEYFNDQNYKGAVDLLKKAIKLDPENHIFFSNRAAAYMALEQVHMK